MARRAATRVEKKNKPINSPFSHNTPCLKKNCISIVFYFSWNDCNIQENLKKKTKVMQSFFFGGGGGGGSTRCIMGDVQMENKRKGLN